MGSGRGGTAASRLLPCEQRDKGILEAWRHRLPFLAVLHQRLGAAQYHPHAIGLYQRVDHASTPMQAFLQFAPPPHPAHQEAMPDQRRMERRGRLLRQQPPLMQQHDIVALLGFVKIGGTDQYRHALRLHALDDAPQLAPRNRIDADGRLVQQQQPRRAQQYTGQAQFLLHASGQRPGATLAEWPECSQPQQVVETCLACGGIEPLQVGVEGEVFLHREVFVQAEALRHVAYVALDGCRMVAGVVAEDTHRTLLWQQQAGGQAHQGGLARTIGAQQAGDQAVPCSHGQPIQGFHTALALVEMLVHALQCQCRPNVEVRFCRHHWE